MEINLCNACAFVFACPALVSGSPEQEAIKKILLALFSLSVLACLFSYNKLMEKKLDLDL